MSFQGIVMRIFSLLPLALLAACQSTAMPKPDIAQDDCGAKSFQTLVGTPARIIDATALPPKTRIIHPDTAVTRDYRLDRLNIHVDEGGQITKVVCG